MHEEFSHRGMSLAGGVPRPNGADCKLSDPGIDISRRCVTEERGNMVAVGQTEESQKVLRIFVDSLLKVADGGLDTLLRPPIPVISCPEVERVGFFVSGRWSQFSRVPGQLSFSSLAT